MSASRAFGYVEAVGKYPKQLIQGNAAKKYVEITPERRPLWRRKKTWLIAALCLVLLALAVGLGVGLGIRHQNTANVDDGDSGAHNTGGSGGDWQPAANTADAQGALTGSGMAVCGFGARSNMALVKPYYADHDPVTLFFQHSSGDIRFMQSTGPGMWVGGTADQIVATDARKGTPIAQGCTCADQVAAMHVFYINQEGFLQQRSFTNLTRVWTRGLLDDQNVRMLDSGRVGLSAALYSGPIDHLEFRITNPASGLRIWAATGDSTFEQYSWRSGLPRWEHEKTWHDLNGTASPVSFDWQAGATSHVMFVNLDDSVRMYWIDNTEGVASTNTHPVDAWVLSLGIKMSNTDPTAGLSLDSNLRLWTREEQGGAFAGWPILFEAENSTMLTGSSPSLRVQGPAGNVGTYMKTYGPTATTGGVLVFYQANGNDIIVATEDEGSGAWSTLKLPVPDS